MDKTETRCTVCCEFDTGCLKDLLKCTNGSTTKYELSETTKQYYKNQLEPRTLGSAGIDLRSTKDVLLNFGETELIPTGLKVHIPEGHVGLVFLRSSMGLKGLRLANGVGVIDSDYRGEILLAIHNEVKQKFFVINAGDRIGQMVILPIVNTAWVGVDSLEETDRGAGGFGSTGQ